jgi:hypothetical protein
MAEARDDAGNVGTGSVTITVSNPIPPAPDTTPPTVTISTPAGGAVVSSEVTVSADAFDDTGVAGVQFLFDGGSLGSEDIVPPYEVTWNSTTASNGSHQLTARARDHAGNVAVAEAITVTVSNATSDLVAAYNFDEGSGTTVVDRSGHGNNGTISGATWAAGRSGGALRFDGINDLVTIADAASLDLTSGMTLMAWVNPTAASGWRTVLLKETTGELAYGLYASEPAGRPSSWVRSGNTSHTAAGTAPVPTNTWTHLAATFDGAMLRIYVNGTPIGTSTVGTSVTTTALPLRIGGNLVWAEWFAGLIDDVRVYNRPLSGSEIQAAMPTPVLP